MRGLVFALLAAAFVASVLGTRYTGRRFIDLGITGILAPVNAGYNRDILSRFGSISGSSLSRTFGSTLLTGGGTGRRTIGFSSVNPYLRSSTTIRGVAPFSGGFESYNEFGRFPSVPSDRPYGFDGPLSRFGRDLGPLARGGPLSGDSVLGPLDGSEPYNGLGPLDGSGPYNGLGPLDGSGPYNGLGPLDGSGPYNGLGPLDGSGPYNGLGPLDGSGPYNGLGPLDGSGPYNDLGPLRGSGFDDNIESIDGPEFYDGLRSFSGLGPLSGNGPLSGEGPDTGDGFFTRRFGDTGPLSGGRISGGIYGPLGYDYEASFERRGAGSVDNPYRGLNGLTSIYPNPYAGLDGRSDLGDRFSSSGFSSSSSAYDFPYAPNTASRSGRTYDLDSRGGYEYLFNDRSFGRDFSVSRGGPGLDINLGGGDGLGFSTQFNALEGQGALSRRTGSSGLDVTLGSPGRNLEYNNNP